MGRPADAQVRNALGPHGQLRFLLSRPWPEGRFADGRQLRELHGVHNIPGRRRIPSRPFNPKNLPATCGKCHPGAAPGSPSARCTSPRGASEPPALKWVRQLYLLLIPVTIGADAAAQPGRLVA